MRDQLLALDHHTEAVRIFIALARALAREQYTVREAAATLRMTPRHLHRRVVTETGCAPHIILALARVRSIERFLTKSKFALTDIAALHGFPDQSAMTRLFKGYLGTTPGAYKAKVRQKRLKFHQRCPKLSIQLDAHRVH
jgi:AraC family transcriptional regulator